MTLFTAIAAAAAFASSAQAAVIAPGTVTATARSEFNFNSGWNRLATSTVNGSGMVSGEGATGLHTNASQSVAYGWQVNQPGNIAHWFKVDLGDTYDVGKMHVWNGHGNSWNGIKTADIYYSTTDSGNNTANDEADFNTSGWNLLTAGQAFQQQANPGDNFGPTDTIALDVTARYIVLNISEAWGGINTTSIGELQFEEAVAVPEPATMGLLALGGLALLRRRRA